MPVAKIRAFGGSFGGCQGSMGHLEKFLLQFSKFS